VQQFLDLNFYLSDFVVMRNPVPTMEKTSYNINEFLVPLDAMEQFQYALHTRESKCPHPQYTKEYEGMLTDLNNMLGSVRASNEDSAVAALINRISEISSYEPESYHSQGAFFHVVLMIQRNWTITATTPDDTRRLVNLLIASLIENFSLAHKYSDPEKHTKYMGRAIDACRRIGELGNVRT
jgi:hypothetical protein